MKRKFVISVFFILTILFGGCNLYNPAEPIPSYIHINEIKVSVTDTSSAAGGQGTRSSKITDAWIYIDEQLIGCFEMPCTIPVLWDGTHTLKIRPGIKVNGIAATRAPYPFYDYYTQPVSLERGSITTITGATVKYLNSTHFYWIEDFEGISSLDTNSHISETGLKYPTGTIANPDIFEGTKSAVGYLRSSNLTFECFSHNKYTLSKADAFLEFNYKCNSIFSVLLEGYTMQGTTITNSQQVEALTFNPSENWNKAYLYLTPAIRELGSATQYKIYFLMQNLSGSDSIGVALDNLKLIQ